MLGRRRPAGLVEARHPLREAVADSGAVRRDSGWLLLAAAAVVLASCSSTGDHSSVPTSAAPTSAPPGSPGGSSAIGGGVAHQDAAGTVWLCRPGIAGDPCDGDLDATAVSASGALSAVPATDDQKSQFDCLYVYPTVSGEAGPNADLAVQASEIGVARLQAARFSQVCDVWAPMYRQVTLSALFTGGLAALNTAYQSLLGTWNDYLHNFNDGRPIIFIGHSQGAAMLIRLLASQIDPNPQLRSRTVVAIIIGGNVQVAVGNSIGGSFEHLPLCGSGTHAGCVIAFSTFPSEPPAGALFGRPGQGVSLQSLQTTTSGQQVACVNPAALNGGTAPLSPYYPAPSRPKVTTPWVTYPGLYTATCEDRDGASWLQVNHVVTAGDTRPVVAEPLGPLWGYHADDVQLTLGNLVSDVRTLEAAYGH